MDFASWSFLLYLYFQAYRQDWALCWFQTLANLSSYHFDTHSICVLWEGTNMSVKLLLETTYVAVIGFVLMNNFTATALPWTNPAFMSNKPHWAVHWNTDSAEWCSYVWCGDIGLLTSWNFHKQIFSCLACWRSECFTVAPWMSKVYWPCPASISDLKHWIWQCIEAIPNEIQQCVMTCLPG